MTRMLRLTGTATMSDLEIVRDIDLERITVKLGAATLKIGQKANLTHTFSGKLDDSTAGFYRASWTSHDTFKHWLATTQLSPVDTRKAFPCFDEPVLKATFSVALLADTHLTLPGERGCCQ